MLSRPRFAENKVASILSEKFEVIGLSPVERIPVTGRRGPDLSINESELVIDIKSRLQVPAGIFSDTAMFFDNYYAVPLSLFPELPDGIHSTFASVIVTKWFDNMGLWTTEKRRNGITALVLHKPKMPYTKAMLIIHKSKLEELCHRLISFSTNPVQ